MSGKSTPFGAAVMDGEREVTVLVWGEIDADSASALGEALTEAIEHGKHVALDMADVGFLDSSGLRELIRARAAVAENGCRLVARAVSPNVARVLQVAGLDEALRAHPDS